MALTKTNTQIHDGTTLTASAGDTTSAAQDLTGSYASVLNVKLTNGATGPTVPAQVKVQLSEDDSKYYDFGAPLVGGVTNAGIYSWSMEIPFGAMYLQLVSGSNTAQDVTLDADISTVTALS